MTTSSSAAFALAFALVAVPCAADDLDPARRLFKEGNELREKGDLAGALDRYVAADALAHTPITGLEVGKAHLALGHLAKARRMFLAVTKLPEDGKESANAKSARADAALLAKEIEPRVPRIVVKVEGAKLEHPAVIEIDGEAAGMMPLLVDPGHHTVTARSEGRSARTEVDLVEGERRSLVLTIPASSLAPTPKSAPPPAATPPSEHERTPTSRRILVYGGFGIAAAGALAGTIAGVITIARAPAVRDACPDGRCPPDAHEDRASLDRMATISTVGFVVAGVGAAIGVVGLVVTPKTERSPRIEPYVGLGSLGVGGHF